MTRKQFRELRALMEEVCQGVLESKGGDYAGSLDCLRNFKQTAELTGMTPRRVWAVYFVKHVVAILTYVKTGRLMSEPILERFVDARNYLDLGYALIHEETPVPSQDKGLLGIRCSEDEEGDHQCGSTIRTEKATS